MPTHVLPTPNGPIHAEIVTPTGQGPWPAVVVVHDIVSATSGGLPDIIKRIADQGYVVIVPNLYSRGGTLRCVRAVFRDLHAMKGRAYDDIEAARQTVLARRDCTGRVGIVGFCMGGGFALVAAARGFDAAAPFYPSLPPARYDDVLDGACPIVASLGRRDPLLIGAGKRLQAALDQRWISSDVKVYDRAGHSFANTYAPAPILRVIGFGHDPEATDDAWGRVFGFFGEHLR